MERLLAFSSVAGPQAFVVHRLAVREALTGIPEYRVDLLSPRSDLSPALLLGTTAAVSLQREGGAPPRWFHGHVTAFACAGPFRSPAFGGALACRYEVVLRPGLWFLTCRSDCRVFRDVTLGDLLARCLSDAGAMSTVVDLGPTECRGFVVQYRETDFQFASRLAEHVGACWAVEHEADAHRLRLTDRPGPATSPGDPVLLRLADRGQAPQLVALSLRHQVQPGRFAGTDQAYAAPRSSLDASASRVHPHAQADEAMFDAPLDVATPAWADTYARLRMEALACGHAQVHGVSTSRELRAGGLARVADHPVAAMNGDWLVTALHLAATNNLAHSGEGAGADVRTEFEAIPADVPWRPARRTPRPVIAGVQSARVVADVRGDVAAPSSADAGPSGAGLGRVRVAFGWDRRSTPSCPVRVSQPWAGRGFGFQNLPRVGDEVLVQFMEGDPDRPVIVGRVHNGDAWPPYALPRGAALTGLRSASLDAQGGSSPTRFNELRFDDSLGAEQVYLQAQRHLDERVAGDRHASIDGSCHRVVGGDRLEAVAGDQHARVDGAVTARVGGALRLAAGGPVQVHAGGRLVLEAAAGLTLRCGPSFVELDAAGVRIDGPLVALRCGGAAEGGQGTTEAQPRAPLPAIRSDGSRPAAPGAAPAA